MVRTVTQNDREPFEDAHFTAIVGRYHPVKGRGVVALQEGDDMLTDTFAVPILGERLALHQIAGIASMLVGLSLSQVRRSLGRGKPGTDFDPA